MPTVHDKLKMAYVHQHPDDGLMLTVTAARSGQQFDMVLTPGMASMLLGQLTAGVKDALTSLDHVHIEGSGGMMQAERVRPASLEVVGNDLIMGQFPRVRLSPSQAAIADLLIKSFGKLVRKGAIYDALYSLDPNGGATSDVLHVQMHRLRSAINDAGMPLLIVTHYAVGWEMRRSEV